MNEKLYEIHSQNSSFAVKYYTFTYHEMPQARVYNFELHVPTFLEQIKVIYTNMQNLSVSNHYYLSPAEPAWDLKHCTLFVVLKEKMLLLYENGVMVLCCGDTVTEAELAVFDGVLLKSLESSKELPKRFYMVKKSDFGNFDMAEFNVKKTELLLHENYNDDLASIHTDIFNFLNNENETGLLLFHGLPGTGKTTYIRHLISACDTRFIYMPNSIAGFISQPDFISFISDFPGCVLVLEDCEELVKPREQYNTGEGITNLLSLGDGLLGDALKLKIICTFNCDLKKIDKALLRKGRLKYRYAFGRLGLEKSKALLAKLHPEKTTNEAMTLADIYNIAENEFELKEQSIGFGA